MECHDIYSGLSKYKIKNGVVIWETYRSRHYINSDDVINEVNVAKDAQLKS